MRMPVEIRKDRTEADLLVLRDLIRRATVDYRRVIDFGPWKLRFQEKGTEFDHDQERLRALDTAYYILLPTESRVDGVAVKGAGRWVVLCEPSASGILNQQLNEMGEAARLELLATLKSLVAIPWMKDPKDFRVVVQHHNAINLRASIRIEPLNVCLATVTGIDAATMPINPEVADRLGAAWNLCVGLETEQLQFMDRACAAGQIAQLISTLQTIARGEAESPMDLAAVVLREVGIEHLERADDEVHLGRETERSGLD